MKRHVLAVTLALFLGAPAIAAPFTNAPLPDPDLAEMRGGFALPGGLSVAIAVRSETVVDGALLLRTVFRADSGPATLDVQAASGAVHRPEADGLGRVSVSREGIDVTHLAGQAYGSVIANRLDNVAIDSATVIDIDIRGATAANLGSTMARVDAIALDTAARLAR